MIKKVLLSTGVSFILVPTIFAVFERLIDHIVPSHTPVARLQFTYYNTLSYLWVLTAMGYSLKFLLLCYIPVQLIITYSENPFIHSYTGRMMLFVIFQFVIIYTSIVNEDHFRSGNSLIKWIVLLMISSSILSISYLQWQKRE